MVNKLYIKEDITDWRDKVLQDESIIENKTDILHEFKRGKRTSDVAISAIVSQAMGKTDILRPFRTLMLVGAMEDVSTIVHEPKVEVETPKGTYQVDQFVGLVNGAIQEMEDNETPAEEPSFVTLDDSKAMERVYDYLYRIVPAHIWNRLVMVYHAKGDVRQASERLKLIIDEMTNRIV